MKEMKEAECKHPIEIFFKSMASTVMTFSPELMVETRTKSRVLTTKTNTQNYTVMTTPSNFSYATEVMDDSSYSNSTMSSKYKYIRFFKP